jgi:N-methylhydantoinase B
MISSARDFSSALLAADGRAVVIDEGIPVHVGSAHLIPMAVLKLFDDIRAGDCFLNNSPFLGNTHHADFTLCSPIFFEGELLFWVMSRAHQADVGAPLPTTYLPYAATVQEEGLHIPCVRVRRDNRDLQDILRIIRHKVRVPELWYGDYLAQVGALTIGEQRILDMCERYGKEVAKAFVEDWIQYGERMMVEEIKRLPSGQWSKETWHDPLPFAPDGIPVRVTLNIDPAAAIITVDLRDNIDNVDAGFNLTEATTLAAAYGGVLNNMSAGVPRNAGSLGRIRVLMREGAIVGLPRPGVGTSVATTNICDRLFNAVQSVFAQAGPPLGMAEGSSGGPPSFSVISGRDRRHGNAFYVNQTIIGYSGGPAVYGHDGWLTYNKAISGGVLHPDSVEINELRFPIRYDALEVVPDTGGPGQWTGAPSIRTVFGPRFDEMTIAYYGDALRFPPAGVVGGGTGGPMAARKLQADGSVLDLPTLATERLLPGERVESVWSAGGGFGDPLERDPERVMADLLEGWVTAAGAREAFGVVVKDVPGSVQQLDREATLSERESRVRHEASATDSGSADR